MPSKLIQSTDSGAFVWLVGNDELAQQRTVEIGKPTTDGLTEIRSGLNFTDKLIASGLEGLKPGIRVEVTGDDQVLGIK